MASRTIVKYIIQKNKRKRALSMQVSNMVLRRMNASNASPQMLARAAKVPVTTVHRVIQGDDQVKLDVVAKILAVFGHTMKIDTRKVRP